METIQHGNASRFVLLESRILLQTIPQWGAWKLVRPTLNTMPSSTVVDVSRFVYRQTPLILAVFPITQRENAWKRALQTPIIFLTIRQEDAYSSALKILWLSLTIQPVVAWVHVHWLQKIFMAIFQPEDASINVHNKKIPMQTTPQDSVLKFVRHLHLFTGKM